jgi:hypothetical protein
MEYLKWLKDNPDAEQGNPQLRSRMTIDPLSFKISGQSLIL